MSKFLKLLILQFKRMGAHPWAMAMFLILPLLLTVPAGLVHKGNDSSRIRPVVYDLAQNEQSRRFIHWLKAGDFPWQEMDYEEAELLLRKEEVDACLVIPKDFELPQKAELILAKGSRGETVGVIMEEVATALIPLTMRNQFLEGLYQSAESIGKTKEEVKEEFMFIVEGEEGSRHDITLKYLGLPDTYREGNRLLWLPEYNIELLFLTLFAVYGSFSLENKAKQQRLLSLRRGFFLESLTSQISLLILGIIQILLLHLGLSQFLPGAEMNERVFLILFTFLMTQLTMAQYFLLLPRDNRFFLALLIMVFSSSLGGCFFSLPSQLMNSFGVWTTHGWAMASLDGVPLLEAKYLIFCALVLSLLAMFAQKAQAQK